VEKNGVTLPAAFPLLESPDKLGELCDLLEMSCSQDEVADMAKSLETTQLYLEGLKDRRKEASDIPTFAGGARFVSMLSLITMLVTRWHEFKPPSSEPPPCELPSYEDAITDQPPAFQEDARVLQC
jgi:hypothetical protein